METATQTPPARTGKFNTLTPEERQAFMEAGRQKRALTIAAWQSIDADPATRLRQTWRDERYMRSIISAAGIKSPSRFEPATGPRLRQMCRRAKVIGLESILGCSPDEFLAKNPRLPLWVAVAHGLESSGQFNERAKKIADEAEAAGVEMAEHGADHGDADEFEEDAEALDMAL